MMFGKLVAIFDVTPKFRIRNTNFPDRCVKNNTDANLEGFRERSPTFCCRPSFLDQARPKTPGLRKGVRVRYELHLETTRHCNTTTGVGRTQ